MAVLQVCLEILKWYLQRALWKLLLKTTNDERAQHHLFLNGYDVYLVCNLHCFINLCKSVFCSCMHHLSAENLTSFLLVTFICLIALVRLASTKCALMSTLKKKWLLQNSSFCDLVSLLQDCTYIFLTTNRYLTWEHAWSGRLN